MCDFVNGWTAAMVKAREAAIEQGCRMALGRTPPVEPGSLASMLGLSATEHFLIVPVDHPLWLQRKGRFTAELAQRAAEQRSVDRGIAAMEEMLGVDHG